MRVAVHHSTLCERYIQLLSTEFPEFELVPSVDEESAREAISSAEVLIAHHDAFPLAALAESQRLQWIQLMSAGVEPWLDLLPADIRLSRVTGSFGVRMAEYVIGYILVITQRVPEVLAQQKERRWGPLKLSQARNKTIAVAGLGSIGRAIAESAATFGMQVVGFSRTAPGLSHIDEWYGPDSWHDFLASADFVVLTLPLTSATRHILDDRALSCMRPGSWLINIARGGLVDELALISSLNNSRLGGAILDVFETEPLPTTSPLWNMSNVIVTPHHSGATFPEEVVEVFKANLPLYRTGAPLINQVDFERGY